MTGAWFWTGGARTAAAITVALTAAGLVVLFYSGGQWAGSWKMALDQGTGSVLLIGPATAGVAAWTYARMRLRHWDLWCAGAARGVRGWLTPLAIVFGLGLAATAGCVALTVGLAQLGGARPAPELLVTTGQAAAVLLCQAVTGAVIGTSTRGVFAAPAAVAGTFLLEALSTPVHVADLFRTGGVTGPLAGETFELGTLAHESALLALVTGVLLLVLVRGAAPQPRLLRYAVGSVLTVAAVTTWASVNAHGYDRYRPVVGEPALSCLGSAPEVCTSVDTRRPLSTLARELHRQSRVLAATGARLPARFVQDLPGHPPADAGVLSLVDDEALSSHVSATSIAITLSTPRACPVFSAARLPEHALDVKYLLASWIALRNGHPSPLYPPGSPEARWLKLPVEQQRAWVRRTYAQLTGCDLSHLAMPAAR